MFPSCSAKFALIDSCWHSSGVAENKSGDDGMRKLALLLGVGFRKTRIFGVFDYWFDSHELRTQNKLFASEFPPGLLFGARYHLFSADKSEQMGFFYLPTHRQPAPFLFSPKKRWNWKRSELQRNNKSNERAQLAAWACGFEIAFWAWPRCSCSTNPLRSRPATTVTYGRRLRRLFLI